MRPPRPRLLPALLATVTVAIGASAVTAATLRSDWIDPKTGHRIIRLSPDDGGSSLYFHQHSYTPQGDKIVISTRAGITAVDLTTLGHGPVKREVIAPGVHGLIATSWRAREAYFRRWGENAIYAVNIDTKAVRLVVKLPPQLHAGATAINCDETLLVGIAQDPDGHAEPRQPPAGNPGAGSLERRWAEGLPMMIYTIDLQTGKLRVIHREHDWTNHLQCSPTDPHQILFCHEGPWQYNDRTWTMRTDGTGLRLLHHRTMNMEIEGHEFFSHDGRTVWYDLQTPRSTVFWLAGVDLATGHRTWYHVRRDEWSVHYNVSPDGRLFAGDGGGPTSVAATRPDGTPLPGGNGQWIYLFRPRMVRGHSLSDHDDLIDTGTFQAERLVDMSRHDYSKITGVEPNLTFTPDGRWIIFNGNFDSPAPPGRRRTTQVYAVQIARSKP